MDRLRRACDLVRRRGIAYLGYLAGGYLLPRFALWWLFESPLSNLLGRIVSRMVPAGRPRETAGAGPEQFQSGRDWLPRETLEAALERQPAVPDEPVVLGRIDNDGRVGLVCGPIPGADPVDEHAFVERRRYHLDVVLENDRVLVRKDFRGDRRAFLREWRSLEALAGRPGCPAVHRAETSRLRLWKSFVPGPTLRQRLVRAGARILSIDTEAEPELARLGPQARIEAVWARGRERFADALPADFLDGLERRLNSVHRRGVTGFSLSFGNVVLHEGTDEPWFIDFDAAVAHRRSSGLAFRLARDRDRDLFNRIYGRELLTERSARALLEKIATPYSPIDLGGGLATRGFWSVDSGTGRWEYLNRHVLAGRIEGRRILDLGSYTGLLPLLMLDAGARQVVGIEKSPELVEVGRHLHRLFEWRFQRTYDFELRGADMRVILDHAWGPYDLVTAFCSLYYLGEDDMRRVVRRAAELAPVLIVQAKIDTRPEAADDKAQKSSLAYLRALLERNGFPRVEVVAPRGYPRPLLIGSREVDPDSRP